VSGHGKVVLLVPAATVVAVGDEVVALGVAGVAAVVVVLVVVVVVLVVVAVVVVGAVVVASGVAAGMADPHPVRASIATTMAARRSEHEVARWDRQEAPSDAPAVRRAEMRDCCDTLRL
jgi:hypothetical protein